MTEIKQDWEPHINVVGNNIWYTGNITFIGVTDLIKELQKTIDSKYVDTKINLFIGSDGGSVTSALMLYNYINLNYKDINIIGTYALNSSATYLLFTKCNTFIYPNISVCFHPMNFAFDDNQQAVKAREKYYKHLIRSVTNIYLTKNYKSNWANEDIYLFADDLITKGIVDDIWENI